MNASLTASMRRTLLTLSLLHGTAGVLLAQGPQDYLVRFRDGTDRPSRAAIRFNRASCSGESRTCVRSLNMHIPYHVRVSVLAVRDATAGIRRPWPTAVRPWSEALCR
jgi:hypothetical protein